MVGTIADVINATQVRLFLDPQATNNEFVLLQEIMIPLDRPETRETVALGSVYFYGQHNNSFTATMLLGALDIPLYLGFNQFTNGALVKKEYDIQLVSKAGNTVKIRVIATTPHQEIEKLDEGGVHIRQTFRITEDVDSGNVV